ncbi:type IV pilus assembly protein PilC [Microbacterium keratanolyticum]|uniref:Type II secretion system protein F n=1 Tax=Microbacterium keratanolyticum TaxID=67574 RepID=A0A9W6M7V5_9MICO|nr:type II secretion system F family protein [Microbacterium keratanolyticum]MBM7468802.1 type IV pilus assembly protein PilC [Microbacterium keratanolyticum]GLK00878.1 type II secretion system protein F [Microbacterium keratanolyticum]
MAIVQEYSYRATDATSGGVVKGTLEAASETAVVNKLRAQGLIPLDVQLLSKTGLNQEITIPGFEKRVKISSLAVFSKQMAGLVTAGLPLLRVLTILSEQTEDKVLQTALVAVQAEVARGAALSVALESHPDVFPPLMISMVRVGEMGGFLADALQSVARTYADEAELQNKIKSATTYPLVVLSIAILGVIAMVTFVVPVFKSIFEGMGSELPLPTQIIVSISNNMIWILPVMIVVAVVGWIWWSRNKNTEAVRKRIDPLKLRMPVFGPLNTKIAVARFARSLSMMLNAGVPLIQALAIVGEASNNYKIEQAVLTVQESVRQGRSFSVPLAKAEVFPSMVAQMVSVGEESGTLPEMLSSIADFYENEVETATEQLTASIEPILIVGIGIIIGGMVISLYLPIFTIYGELGAA